MKNDLNVVSLIIYVSKLGEWVSAATGMTKVSSYRINGRFYLMVSIIILMLYVARSSLDLILPGDFWKAKRNFWQIKNVEPVDVLFKLRVSYAQYTPPTRLNCRVESCRRCVHNSQLADDSLIFTQRHSITAPVRNHPSLIKCQYQCNWLAGKTRLQNNQLCVECYTFSSAHSAVIISLLVASVSLRERSTPVTNSARSTVRQNVKRIWSSGSQPVKPTRAIKRASSRRFWFNYRVASAGARAPWPAGWSRHLTTDNLPSSVSVYPGAGWREIWETDAGLYSSKTRQGVAACLVIRRRIFHPRFENTNADEQKQLKIPQNVLNLRNFCQRVSIASYASAGIARAEMSVCPSVCLSVRHTPVLYQNEES